MEAFLKTKTPFYKREVDYEIGLSIVGMEITTTLTMFQRLRYNTMYLPKILKKRISESAPAGADLKAGGIKIISTLLDKVELCFKAKI